MAEIIELNGQAPSEEITKERALQLKSAMAYLDGIIGSKEDVDDLAKIISSLMTMPDPQFEMMSPGILQRYLKSLNNPSDQILLAQSLNAMNIKAEDLTDEFETLIEEVNKLPVSAPKKDFLKEMFTGIMNSVMNVSGVSKRIMTLAVERCHPEAQIPQYAHISDSGADVYAVDDYTIHPGETVLIPTGLKIGLPPGYEIQVRPRSGNSLRTKLRIANAPGTIDQGYREEIKVIVENVEPPIKSITTEPVFKEDGTVDHLKVTSILYGADYTISKGERFCQLVLMEVPKMAFYDVDELTAHEDNIRTGGFGSTGE